LMDKDMQSASSRLGWPDAERTGVLSGSERRQMGRVG
jgi:hypothetical protein